uniref:Tc1-like transposase DDE domain-containing protein n=1 Tax=Homalodisca liturata TaxID=320908 RepID=A0A1B6IQK1_9HEMI
MRFAAKDLTCGRLKIGGYTTTMRQLIQTFLAKHGTPQVPQPPYSPDMAPCDFWLFPHLKKPLKGTRFESREAIMKKTTADLMAMPKSDFQDCFQKWKRRWNRCVASQGAYFEEN